MGNCFKSTHRLLAEEEKRTAALQSAALTLAEIAHSYEVRKEDIEKEIQQQQRLIAGVLHDYKRGLRERVDAERVLLDLEMKQRMAIARLTRAQQNVLMYRKHEANVLELQSTMSTTMKMTALVGSLKKIGVKVENLDKQNDAVDDIMGKVREITESQDEMVSSEVAIDLRGMDEEAQQHVSKQLDRLDNINKDEFERELDSIDLPGSAKKNKGTSRNPHVIAEPSQAYRTLENEEDEVSVFESMQ
jgi:hypothetical protein